MEIVDAHMHLWTPETHPWLLGVKDGGHPAGKFSEIVNCKICGRAPHTLFLTEPVLTYLLDRYREDTRGYNVTQCVHVEACWPGDPVAETRLVTSYLCSVVVTS